MDRIAKRVPMWMGVLLAGFVSGSAVTQLRGAADAQAGARAAGPAAVVVEGERDSSPADWAREEEGSSEGAVAPAGASSEADRGDGPNGADWVPLEGDPPAQKYFCCKDVFGGCIGFMGQACPQGYESMPCPCPQG